MILDGRPPARSRRSTTRSARRGGSGTLLTLDLKAQDKSMPPGPTIIQRWGKLDVLVGNAGILGCCRARARHRGAWNVVLR